MRNPTVWQRVPGRSGLGRALSGGAGTAVAGRLGMTGAAVGADGGPGSGDGARVPGGRRAEGPVPRSRRAAIQVPWARNDAGHTRRFDDTVAWLAVHCSKTAVVELTRITWRSVGATVTRGRRTRWPVLIVSTVAAVGIDEISYKNGHHYLTVVVDHDPRKRVWATAGRDRATLARFFGELGEERAAQITHVTADAATGSPLPAATRCRQSVVCADAFHVAAGSTKAGITSPAGSRTGEGAGPRPLRVVEEPRGPERLPARQARLDRQDRPEGPPRLPPQRGDSARVQGQGRPPTRPPRPIRSLMRPRMRQKSLIPGPSVSNAVGLAFRL